MSISKFFHHIKIVDIKECESLNLQYSAISVFKLWCEVKKYISGNVFCFGRDLS